MLKAIIIHLELMNEMNFCIENNRYFTGNISNYILQPLG